jgi:hypothetical protein
VRFIIYSGASSSRNAGIQCNQPSPLIHPQLLSTGPTITMLELRSRTTRRLKPSVIWERLTEGVRSIGYVYASLYVGRLNNGIGAIYIT